MRYHVCVIQRLYIHNFRCLENFSWTMAEQSSALLIGKNGSGKSTLALALSILQSIARGTNRVGDLIKPKDLARGRSESPLRLLIEAQIDGSNYKYELALEFPPGFRELRVRQEKFEVNNEVVFNRDLASLHLRRSERFDEIDLSIDWHLVALPIVSQHDQGPLPIFRRWLSRMLILRPVPALILGDSTDETLEPDIQVTKFGAWFSGLLASSPSAYGRMEQYLRQVMPDFYAIKNPSVGSDSRNLEVHFRSGSEVFRVNFQELSDGEKCFMICGLVLAANDEYGPLCCFWDEPDNYLALDEVGHFVLALRKGFQKGGQFIATSHNQEAIRRFSSENTFVLSRKSHVDPTIIRPLSEIEVSGDLVSALLQGDLNS